MSEDSNEIVVDNSNEPKSVTLSYDELNNITLRAMQVARSTMPVSLDKVHESWFEKNFPT